MRYEELIIKYKVTDAPEWEYIDNVGRIVRCKDCRFYTSDGGAMMKCYATDMIVNDEDYCSYGERREP